ncbi:hypothetical protein CIHG_09699 [Coccidioides immitis H538.4]|uniref:Uncharacterized protein n=1 Tax=Coccidioides immitis H538.4 TaxID=396776 RepID=A0A0J8UVL7_COCIT|nr:hypothetical protein CIHG_09699 [Coccidioides immitis H538.4]
MKPLSYVQLSDFTAVVTATILQALPILSRLNSLLATWEVRSTVLRQIPRLLRGIKLARTDVDAALGRLKLGDFATWASQAQKMAIENEWRRSLPASSTPKSRIPDTRSNDANSLLESRDPLATPTPADHHSVSNNTVAGADNSLATPSPSALSFNVSNKVANPKQPVFKQPKNPKLEITPLEVPSNLEALNSAKSSETVIFRESKTLDSHSSPPTDLKHAPPSTSGLPGSQAKAIKCFSKGHDMEQTPHAAIPDAENHIHCHTESFTPVASPTLPLVLLDIIVGERSNPFPVS